MDRVAVRPVRRWSCEGHVELDRVRARIDDRELLRAASRGCLVQLVVTGRHLAAWQTAASGHDHQRTGRQQQTSHALPLASYTPETRTGFHLRKGRRRSPAPALL